MAVLSLEELNPFLDQFRKGLRIDLQLVRRDQRLVNPDGDNLVARFLGEGRIVLPKKAAFARNGFDHAQAFQLRISLGHGVAVQMQLLGQRSNGRERFASLEAAGSGGVAHLIDQLQINRLAGFKIDLKCHAVP